MQKKQVSEEVGMVVGGQGRSEIIARFNVVLVPGMPDVLMIPRRFLLQFESAQVDVFSL